MAFFQCRMSSCTGLFLLICMGRFDFAWRRITTSHQFFQVCLHGSAATVPGRVTYKAALRVMVSEYFLPIRSKKSTMMVCQGRGGMSFCSNGSSLLLLASFWQIPLCSCIDVGISTCWLPLRINPSSSYNSSRYDQYGCSKFGTIPWFVLGHALPHVLIYYITGLGRNDIFHICLYISAGQLFVNIFKFELT